MEIILHVSDADYRDLMGGGHRLRGSIGILNAKEATFNRHHQDGRPKAPGYRFKKLTHGRISVTDERVRLSLSIDRKEAGVCASECIYVESAAASRFVSGEVNK